MRRDIEPLESGRLTYERSLFSSLLVVQGEIGRVLSARDVSRSTRSHTLVTDLVLNVTMTFKGPAMSEVAVVQLGGKQGNRERIPDQYRMMRTGERYILFLKQDPRSQSVALAGIKQLFLLLSGSLRSHRHA